MLRPHDTITPLPDNEPDAVPELWNSRYREMDDNFTALDNHLASVLDSITGHGERITDIENQSAGSVSQALRLDWLYSAKKKIALELFYDSWSLLPGLTSTVVDAVAGDDSLDLDTTAGLEPGTEYVIFDGTHQETVSITEILTQTRVRCADSLAHSFTNAPIRRTSWTVSDGKAAAGNGGIYLAPNLNLGNENQDKALVVRRHDNDTALSVYFRDSAHPDWTKAAWSWIRSIEDGIVDVEYRLPARGIFDIRITSTAGQSGEIPDIFHIAFVDEATGLGGLHHPPETPAIVYPADGAIDVSEQPSLTTGAYVHDGGVALRGSEFQISTSGDFSSGSLLDASGLVPGISYSPQKDVLNEDTAYYARARHTDIEGGTSTWSEIVSFTTADVFITVNKPSGLAPAPGSELGEPDSLTLVSSAFGTEGGSDTHAASQWQLASDPLFQTLVHDSGTTGTDLTDHNVPDGILERGRTYYWRVRHQGAAKGWSDWSDALVFGVASFSCFVSLLGGSGRCVLMDLAIDTADNVYTAGYEEVSTGRWEALLVKSGPSGNLVWQKKLGGAGDDNLRSVATDNSGNVYVAGYERSSTSYHNALLAKFDPDGGMVWQKTLRGSGDELFISVATDDSGYVYAAGYGNSSGNHKALLAKFDSNGNLEWKKKLGRSDNEYFETMAIDHEGNLYAAGHIFATGNEDSPAGDVKALIAKFDSDGGLIWQKTLAGVNKDYFQTVTTDSAGNIYVTGVEQLSESSHKALIVRLYPNGSISWQKELSGGGNDFFQGITADASGNIYAVGGENSATGSRDALVAKFTQDGNLVWQKTLGGLDDEHFQAVGIDSTGKIYAAGYEDSSAGYSQALLVSISPDAYGANGLIPGLTTFSWGNPGLAVTTSTLTLNDAVLTPGVSTLTEGDPALTPDDPGLTQTLSGY
ncbi:MAG: SBBP repeat-containing protein [Desulfobacter sp.]